MEMRRYGASGLLVSALGLGAGGLGDGDEGEAERLIHAAVDLGIRLVDTARSYAGSEERLGRFLGGRRHHVVLSTKLGYGIDGVADWTGEAVTRGVEEALGRLRTDVIDVVHLHSCGLDVLMRGDVIEALERARDAGKIRVAAYSGENRELDWALDSGRFGGLQCSVSVFDPNAARRVCAPAAAAGIGVIAKRPLGNAPWRYQARPEGAEADKYWGRYAALELDPSPLAWAALAIRWAAHAAGVASAITGTGSVAHLEESARAVEAGPLDDGLAERVSSAHARVAGDWPGII